ncbi:MAG: hypothetical protein A2787_01235 [Omnitrophica WOR_2 bacterium RIFCSPHIGHO2_01_FULL_48_9]|nr:MAG: hypothetical protein A2787_01235 [Omnitrophica WOR_2 bacterium RIFCSPHIGHO2_01_FULL_48_9]
MQNNISIVLSINISKGGIPKLPVDSIQVTSSGLAGDGHNHEKHQTPLQAVSLQDMEELTRLCEEGFSLSAGTTGENLTVRNLNVNRLPIGTILEFTSGIILEVTKIRKPCYVLDAIDPKLKEVIVGRCGIYAKVLKEGTLTMGDQVRIV